MQPSSLNMQKEDTTTAYEIGTIEEDDAEQLLSPCAWIKLPQARVVAFRNEFK
jgi:hypothetical protein